MAMTNEPTWEDTIHLEIEKLWDRLADLYEAGSDIHRELVELRFYVGEGRDGLTMHEQYETMDEIRGLESILSRIDDDRVETERRIRLLEDLRTFGPLL